jgi:hypothetical protein
MFPSVRDDCVVVMVNGLWYICYVLRKMVKNFFRFFSS